MNEVKTQGTELYVLDTTVSPPTVRKIANLVNIDSVGGQAGDIDLTNLDDLRFKRFVSGLIDPGSASIGLNVDPQDGSLEFLNDNAGGDNFKWAIGTSEDFGNAPGINGSENDFDLDTTRTWFTFEASVKQKQYNFSVDSIIKFASALRLSGDVTLTKKST